MTVIYWFVIIALFVLAFLGLLYPIIPSAPLLLLAFILYGFFFSFEPFNFMFWVIQLFLLGVLLISDNVANIFTVKKFGGSRAGIWGSTIGLVLGPFLIPGWGLLIGPFAGAFLAEWIVHKRGFTEAVKIGFSTLISLISSVFVKAFIMAIMIGYFLISVL